MMNMNRFDMRARRAPALPAVLSLLLVGCLAAPAHAAIYFSDRDEGRIGRADNDGTDVDLIFIRDVPNASGVAVDDNYLYWADQASIGRASLDGTIVEPQFISAWPGIPVDVYVSATHIYWTDAPAGRIGRANLDGSNVNMSFIDVDGNVQGIAGDDNYLYFAVIGAGTIGRATLDGVTVETDFVTGLQMPGGVAVTATHLYWSSASFGRIGRAAIDGTSVQPNFITGLEGQPAFLDTDATHIYWGQYQNGHVGRAALDGSGLQSTYIYGGTSIAGAAIDGLDVPSDPAASCPDEPDPTCALLPGSSQLSITGGTKPRTKVSVKKTTVATHDVGAPDFINGTSLRLCLYVDDALAVEAGATAGDPGFKVKPGKIMTYKNAEASGDLSAIKMKVGDGNGMVSATAAEAPPLPLMFSTGITADLRTTEGCFTATWTSDDIAVSTGTKLIAK